MVYKWYVSCQLGDGLCHRSHLLREPKTTTDFGGELFFTSMFLVGSGNDEANFDVFLACVCSNGFAFATSTFCGWILRHDKCQAYNNMGVIFKEQENLEKARMKD